jgi:hypothetical protein
MCSDGDADLGQIHGGERTQTSGSTLGGLLTFRSVYLVLQSHPQPDVAEAGAEARLDGSSSAIASGRRRIMALERPKLARSALDPYFEGLAARSHEVCCAWKPLARFATLVEGLV